MSEFDIMAISFPIEIRPGVVAQVKIPRDLTKEEAEKICRVVMALAVPNGDRA